MRDRDFLMALAERFILLSPGASIDRPNFVIRVGAFLMSRRSLKHIVERRLSQGADPLALIEEMLIMLEKPQIAIGNPKDARGFIVGGLVSDRSKAIFSVLDENMRIVSAYYKRHKQFEAIKSQLIDSGGAADPSSFLPEGNLAASLSALRNRSAGSLTSKRISKRNG